MNTVWLSIEESLLSNYADLSLTEQNCFSQHQHVINFTHPQGGLFAVVDETVAVAPRQLRLQGHLPCLELLALPLMAPPAFSCQLVIPDVPYQLAVIEAGWQLLAQIAASPKDKFQVLLQNYLQQGIQAVLRDLSDTQADLKSATAQLLGLGTGLTPTGDDFLCGILISLALPCSPYHQRREKLVDAISQQLSRTHLISAAFLTDACQKQISSPVQHFIDSLFDGQNVQTVLANIVALGHRSGYDLLSGLLAGLPHPIERRILLCPYIVD